MFDPDFFMPRFTKSEHTLRLPCPVISPTTIPCHLALQDMRRFFEQFEIRQPAADKSGSIQIL